MRPALALVLALQLLPAAAVAETPLTGAEIAALLPGVVALGEGTRQTFLADGGTLYTDARGPSAGRWRVEGDRYCSQWPPAESWACYGVLRDGDRLIWVDARGGRTLNTLAVRP